MKHGKALVSAAVALILASLHGRANAGSDFSAEWLESWIERWTVETGIVVTDPMRDQLVAQYSQFMLQANGSVVAAIDPTGVELASRPSSSEAFATDFARQSDLFADTTDASSVRSMTSMNLGGEEMVRIPFSQNALGESESMLYRHAIQDSQTNIAIVRPWNQAADELEIAGLYDPSAFGNAGETPDYAWVSVALHRFPDVKIIVTPIPPRDYSVLINSKHYDATEQSEYGVPTGQVEVVVIREGEEPCRWSGWMRNGDIQTVKCDF